MSSPGEPYNTHAPYRAVRQREVRVGVDYDDGSRDDVDSACEPRVGGCRRDDTGA